MKTIQFLLAILFVIATVVACGGGYGSGSSYGGGANPTPYPNGGPGGSGGGGGGLGGIYSISGTVSGGLTNNSGVLIYLTGAATMSTTTAAGGNFSFSGLANGSYTVTPMLMGYTFSPASAPVAVSFNNPSGINFTESP